MQKDVEITIAPNHIEKEKTILESLSAALKIKSDQITGYKILKRSIDARSRKVVYRMQVRAFINET